MHQNMKDYAHQREKSMFTDEDGTTTPMSLGATVAYFQGRGGLLSATFVSTQSSARTE